MTTKHQQLAKLPAPKLGLTRKYAGGGFISSLFGSSKPETVTEKFARQDAEFKAKHPERFQQEQPATQTAPAQPAQGFGGIRGMVGGSLTKNLQDREKAAGLKAGGMVRKKCVDGGKITGPGGPTDDLVPIDASNGEFMIKASSAKILGPDVLEALNDLGDEPKNPKDGAAEDAKEGEGMRVGGMVRKPKRMASGGWTSEDQASLDRRVAQIPAGGTAPAPDGSSQQSDFMRDLENTANALPGVGGALSGGAALASTVPAVVRGLAAAKPLISKGFGMAKAVAPYAVPAVGAGALQALSSPDTPASTPALAASTPAALVRKEPSTDLTSGINAAMTNSQTDLATTGMKANTVYKTKQANGTTAYSGYGDGTGKVGGMVRGDGSAVQGRGSVSVMPAMGAGAIKSALTNPDGTAWTANDSAIMAANLRDGVDQYRGTSREAKPDPMSQHMTKDQRAGRVRMAEIASQDKRYGEANAIQQEQLGMSRTEHAAKMASQKQLQDAQAEYLAAGDNPAKLKEADRKLILLGGKQPTPSRMVVVPGGQEIVDGMTRTVPSRVFDTDTKQYVDPQGIQAKQPLDNHIAALKNNPQLAAQFDAQYGAGASAKYLGFEVGKTYKDANGNRAKWDGKAFVPI